MNVNEKRIRKSIIALLMILLLAFTVSCFPASPGPVPREETITYVEDPNYAALAYIKRCIAPTDEEKKSTPGESFSNTDESSIPEKDVLSTEMIDRIIQAMKDSKNIRTPSNSDLAGLDLTRMNEKGLKKVSDRLRESFTESDVKIENGEFIITATDDYGRYTYTQDAFGNLTLTATYNDMFSKIEYSVMLKAGNEEKDYFFRQDMKDNGKHILKEMWHNAVADGETRNYYIIESQYDSKIIVEIDNPSHDEIPEKIEREIWYDSVDGVPTRDYVKTQNTLLLKDILSYRTAETNLIRDALYKMEIRMSPTTREGEIKLSDDLMKLLPENLSLTSSKLNAYRPDNSDHFIIFKEDYFVWKISVTEDFDWIVDVMTAAGYADENDHLHEYVTTGEGWKMIMDSHDSSDPTEIVFKFDKSCVPTVW